MKEKRGDNQSVLDLDPRSCVDCGVEDVYGEDRATEEQLVTPWTVSVARFFFFCSFVKITRTALIQSFPLLVPEIILPFLVDVKWLQLVKLIYV